MTTLQLDAKQLEALKHIRNYLNQNGKMPSVRELMSAMEYKSPRSASVMFEKLVESGVLNRCPMTRKLSLKDFNSSLGAAASTVDVPLVGTTSCSGPLFAEENVEAYYKVSSQLARSDRPHFFLRIQGDSMNQAGIQDGDLVLIRQQNTAKPGDLVLALIDDEATIKKFDPQAGVSLLRPCSDNPVHKPIILTHDFAIQGIVMQSFSNL